METQFWHERWEQNKTGFHQNTVNPHLQRYWRLLNTPPGGFVFVPLCGKSGDMLWLLNEGYRVLGVELSPIAVNDFFVENLLKPETSQMDTFHSWQSDRLNILQGDFFDLKTEHLAACRTIYDRAALIALPPEMRRRYTRHLLNVAPAVENILLLTFEYDQSRMSGPPFSVTEQEVTALYSSQFRIDRLHVQDILEENSAFKDRGLDNLVETVYRLEKIVPGPR